jgi:hypothetical protein
MDIQSILSALTSFIGESVIPFLMVLALFLFLWNAARYFIIGGANPDDQEKARSLAIWGVVAFFVMTALWGIVYLVGDAFGISDPAAVVPDYMNNRVGDLQERCTNPATFNESLCCSDFAVAQFGPNPFIGCFTR